MTTIADVRTGVNRVFDALGAPSWSNPHADHSVAAEEEYSRVTDPERYRVLMLRLQAWQTVLAKLCDVDVDTMAKGRGRLQQRWSSPHSDTLPLYVSVVTLTRFLLSGCPPPRMPIPSTSSRIALVMPATMVRKIFCGFLTRTWRPSLTVASSLSLGRWSMVSRHSISSVPDRAARRPGEGMRLAH